MTYAHKARLDEAKQLLTCANGGRHIMHLHDNRELTFGELKRVLLAASDGKLERTYEKLDGQALVFTWAGETRVARAGGEINNGGLDAVGIAEKFKGRGALALAFEEAFHVLNEALSALDTGTLHQVFQGGRLWYSAEVIYSGTPNVVNYDGNYVVFHASPVFRVDESGAVVKEEEDGNAPGVAILDQHINRMQRAVHERSWRVHGPVLLRLKGLSDGSIVKRTIDTIQSIQNDAGVGDEDTIEDLLINVIEEKVADLDLPHDISLKVVARIVETPGHPKLLDIKRVAPAGTYSAINTLVKAGPGLLKQAIFPLEQAIHSFSVELLRGMQSVLIDDSDAEVSKLRTRVKGAVERIRASGNEAAIDVLHQQLQKLGSVDNITTPAEGIVFQYKGKTYKFTSNFAPLNAILGLLKYGRGAAIPPLNDDF